jgi:tetratricopeptide (TPR) repeat protein
MDLRNRSVPSDLPNPQKEYDAAQARLSAHGPLSPMISMPLQSLGTNALAHKDYPTALKFYTRAVEINEKVFGEASNKVADSLRILSRVYLVQKEFDQAEPILLRAVKIDESLFGRDGGGMLIPLSTLCGVYDAWGQPAKSEPCARQLLAVLEKQFGENSLQIVSVLKSQAHALRSLGRGKKPQRSRCASRPSRPPP